jgi:hypothetical protein
MVLDSGFVLSSRASRGPVRTPRNDDSRHSGARLFGANPESEAVPVLDSGFVLSGRASRGPSGRPGMTE